MNTHPWSFIVIGDTQRTSFLERVFLRREVNDTERKFLFEGIENHDPRFLVVVGDLVRSGASREWNYFFSLAAGLKKLGISIYPAKGNHDLKIEGHFCFLIERTWYSMTVQSVGLIWLDTTDHGESQRAWFGRTLAAMDSDVLIENIIVFGHHPPFTNSVVVSPSKYVKKIFVPEFLSGVKTRVFISGHSHGYERFEKGGKTFIVTGGGGGPRPKSAPFPFHYLKITQERRGFSIDVFGLQKFENQVRHLSTMTLGGGPC